MPEPETKGWYLVYCKPRQERVAQVNLGRQGFENYLPLIRQPRRRAGKRVMIVEPMFPRYLFVQLDSQRDDWGPIRSTLGVTSLVRFGQQAARVPAQLVDMLRAHEDVQGVQDLPPPDYRRGDAVRIVDGAMMGYEGIFLARSGKERVVVLLNIMGKLARVKVDERFVEPTR